MKAFSKYVAFFIIILSIFTTSVSAATIPNELNRYRTEANRILDKYYMRDKMEYQLFVVPEKTLEEYSEYLDSIVSNTADAFKIIEKIDSAQTFSPVNPRVIYLRETKLQYKAFGGYFIVSCIYDIVRPDGDNKVWLENPRGIQGSVNALGVAMFFHFYQSYTTASFHSDGTIQATAVGRWTAEQNGIVQEMGTVGITGKFGGEFL